MVPCARFDDLGSVNPRAFALRGLQRTVVARRLDDVVPALEAVEVATRDEGLWAGGFVAYEAAPAFDRALRVRSRDLEDVFAHLPMVWFGLFDRREAIPMFEPRVSRPAPYTVSAWTPTVGRDDYLDAVHKIRRHIEAGDTYQVNYTFRLRAAFGGKPDELYRDLVLAQGGSYGAYFDLGRYRVLSASPELFFRLEGDRIITKPMKGTIRRGRWTEEDLELATRLSDSEKDRAENLMIVDLIRNDLGKIAVAGTVTADRLCELERYETLWQLTSEVEAQVDPDLSLVDAFGALFPSGSVTGAPKVRTMEIICGLERSPRGVYCGAVGFVAPKGTPGPRAVFNVGIRTVAIDLEEGVAEYGVGGGITWDSVPDIEFEEARTKARLLVERRPDFDLLETIRWDEDHGFWWLDEHMDRMEASAGYFGYRFDRRAAIEALAAAVAQCTRSRRVRLLSDREGRFTVEVDHEALATILDGPDADEPTLRVCIDDEPVTSDDVFLFHKTTLRRRYDERRWRHPHVHDVVMVNERGEVTESATANLVVRFGSEWWTPPLDSGLLPGVYRRVLLDKGAIRERPIAVHELAAADEIALVNSVRGWRRVEVVPPAED